MADIDIERKRTIPWWLFLLLALPLIGVIWWLVAANSGDRDDIAQGTAAPPIVAGSPTEGSPPPSAATDGETAADAGTTAAAAGTAGEEGAGAMTLAAVVTDPASHFGHTITTTATVVKPDSDRGFWLDAEGEQVFVVLAKSLDTPDTKTDINAGQKVRLTGTIHDASKASGVEELKAVTKETQKLLSGVKFFVRATDIAILQE